MKKSVISIWLAFSVMTAQAQSPSDKLCIEALQAADEAIASLQDQVQAQKEFSEQLNKHLTQAAEMNKILLERQNAWYRDPQIIGTTGLIAGLLLGAWIVRQR